MLVIGVILFLEFGLQKKSPWLSFLVSLLSPCFLCWVKWSVFLPFSPGLTLILNVICPHCVSAKQSIQVLQIRDYANLVPRVLSLLRERTGTLVMARHVPARF